MEVFILLPSLEKKIRKRNYNIFFPIDIFRDQTVKVIAVQGLLELIPKITFWRSVKVIFETNSVTFTSDLTGFVAQNGVKFYNSRI